MKSRLLILSALFFALVMFANLPAKADNRPNQPNDKNCKNNSSDKDLPINTSIVALLVAGAGIGVIAIKRSATAKAL